MLTADEQQVFDLITVALAQIDLPEGLTLTEPAAELFRSADLGTSHVPELRALQQRLQFVETIGDLARHAGRFLTGGDLDRVTIAWSAYLSRRGSCVSSMIAGREDKTNDHRYHRSSSRRRTKKSSPPGRGGPQNGPGHENRRSRLYRIR